MRSRVSRGAAPRARRRRRGSRREPPLPVRRHHNPVPYRNRPRRVSNDVPRQARRISTGRPTTDSSAAPSGTRKARTPRHTGKLRMSASPARLVSYSGSRQTVATSTGSVWPSTKMKQFEAAAFEAFAGRARHLEHVHRRRLTRSRRQKARPLGPDMIGDGGNQRRFGWRASDDAVAGDVVGNMPVRLRNHLERSNTFCRPYWGRPEA